MIEFAWAAGLFEGEGCIILRFNDKTGGVELRLLINMTDEDVVQRFHAIVGVGRVHPVKRHRNYPDHWKDSWRWQVVGKDAAHLLNRLVPFLGERRTARAAEALIAYEGRVDAITRERVCPGCNSTFSPPLSKQSMRRIYCSAACKNIVLNARYRGITA